VATYLDSIGAWHRAAASRDHRDLQDLATKARASSPPRDFAGALKSHGGASLGEDTIALIAEIKRRSPSKGDLNPGLDPAQVGRAYEAGGASCLSVLTDGPYFAGSPEDLRLARGAVGIPVLRKDFTVSAADVYDARLMGADAVLLIVALLDRAELAQLHEIAEDLAMAVLVEVHDERELELALGIGASLVGVNQRDLHTFEVDRGRAARVAHNVPAGVLKVAESGVSSAGDVAALAEAGFDAVLVGEALVRRPDQRAAVAELLGRNVPCG
jgi:indole-3-glycerol phosphate synthase